MPTYPCAQVRPHFFSNSSPKRVLHRAIRTQEPKEHTWYAPSDKWVLAQKLGIPKIQFTDQIKLKRKEEQIMDTLILLRRGNKIPTGGDTVTKYGAETEEKDIQRLLHLGIHPTYS